MRWSRPVWRLLVTCLLFAVFCSSDAQAQIESLPPSSESSESSDLPLLVGHGERVPSGATSAAKNSSPDGTITDVIVLIDSTKSMAWPLERERRLGVAQWSTLDVADSIPEEIPAAFVALADEASALRQLLPLGTNDRGQLRRTVMRLKSQGDGKLDKLLTEARRLLAAKPDSVPLLVLVTDGVDCDPFSHGAPIRDLHSDFGDRLHFQVIGIGDNREISAKLRDLANQGGPNGEFSSVKSHADLPAALSSTRSLFEGVRIARHDRAEQQAASLAVCEKDRRDLTRQVARLTREGVDLRADVARLEETNEKQADEIANLTRERDTLTTRVSELDEQVETLSEQNTNLAKDNERLSVDNAKLGELSEARLAEIGRLTQEKSDLELSSESYRRAYLTWLTLALIFLVLFVIASMLWWFKALRLTDRLGQAGSERDKLKEQYTELNGKLDELNVHLRHLEEQLDEAQVGHTGAQSDLGHARTKIDELKEEVHRLRHELKDCGDARQHLVHKLDDARDLNEQHARDINRLNDEVTELTERVKRLKRKNEDLEERTASAEQEANSARHQLSECRERNGRMEERLNACQQDCSESERRIRELEHALNHAREDVRRYSHRLRRCREHHDNHSQELLRVSTEGAAAASRAEELERALHECQRNSSAVQHAANVSRAEQAAAFADTLGVTREMAANGRHHDHCCHSQSTPIVMGPTVTPAYSAASPVANPGAPSAPAATAGAGTAGAGTAGSGTAGAGTAGAGTAGSGTAGAGTAGAATAGAGTSGPAAGGSAASGSAAGGGAAGAPAGAGGGDGDGPLIPGLPGILGGDKDGGLGGLLGIAGTALGTTIGGPVGGLAGGPLGRLFG
jgi:peptidoglycan hydrolase CwlO-like protein